MQVTVHKLGTVRHRAFITLPGPLHGVDGPFGAMPPGGELKMFPAGVLRSSKGLHWTGEPR